MNTVTFSPLEISEPPVQLASWLQGRASGSVVDRYATARFDVVTYPTRPDDIMRACASHDIVVSASAQERVYSHPSFATTSGYETTLVILPATAEVYKAIHAEAIEKAALGEDAVLPLAPRAEMCHLACFKLQDHAPQPFTKILVPHRPFSSPRKSAGSRLVITYSKDSKYGIDTLDSKPTDTIPSQGWGMLRELRSPSLSKGRQVLCGSTPSLSMFVHGGLELID